MPQTTGQFYSHSLGFKEQRLSLLQIMVLLYLNTGNHLRLLSFKQGNSNFSFSLFFNPTFSLSLGFFPGSFTF